jgi:hypothetical protein
MGPPPAAAGRPEVPGRRPVRSRPSRPMAPAAGRTRACRRSARDARTAARADGRTAGLGAAAGWVGGSPAGRTQDCRPAAPAEPAGAPVIVEARTRDRTAARPRERPDGTALGQPAVRPAAAGEWRLGRAEAGLRGHAAHRADAAGGPGATTGRRRSTTRCRCAAEPAGPGRSARRAGRAAPEPGGPVLWGEGGRSSRRPRPIRCRPLGRRGHRGGRRRRGRRGEQRRSPSGPWPYWWTCWRRAWSIRAVSARRGRSPSPVARPGGPGRRPLRSTPGSPLLQRRRQPGDHA